MGTNKTAKKNASGGAPLPVGCPKLQIGMETWMPIRFLGPDPGQIRVYFDPEELKGTAESIKMFGQQEAIKATLATSDQLAKGIAYEVLDGERRYRSALLAKVEKVLVVLRPEVDRGVMRQRQQIISNFHRAQHTHGEVARALLKQKEEGGLTIAELAVLIDRSTATVGNYLRFNLLHPDLQALVDPPTPDEDRLNFQVAISLTSASHERQLEIYSEYVGVLRANVNKGRKLVADAVRNANAKDGKKMRGRQPAETFEMIERLLRRFLKDLETMTELRKVDLQGVLRSRSTIEVDKSLSELDRILSDLKMVRNEFWEVRQEKYSHLK